MEEATNLSLKNVYFCFTQNIESAIEIGECSAHQNAYDVANVWFPFFEIETTTELAEDKLSKLSDDKSKVNNRYLASASPIAVGVPQYSQFSHSPAKQFQQYVVYHF